jgi:hypothetical protein
MTSVVLSPVPTGQYTAPRAGSPSDCIRYPPTFRYAQRVGKSRIDGATDTEAESQRAPKKGISGKGTLCPLRRIGDSSRREIDYGLAHSSFGAAVFSQSFSRRGWAHDGLGGTVSLTIAGKH